VKQSRRRHKVSDAGQSTTLNEFNGALEAQLISDPLGRVY